MRTTHGTRTLSAAALFAVAVLATTTACGSGTSGGAAPKSTGKALTGLEGKAYGLAPYAWATRHPSTIGVYGIDLHGQSFTVGGTVRMALFKDGGIPGVPVWTRDTTAHAATGRPGGVFNVRTGLLDCTAYGYTRDSTLMAWDIATNKWSNRVRVSTGCSH